ncbi:DUF2510 domain-containing protein [Jatrophihabitans fulvus]
MADAGWYPDDYDPTMQHYFDGQNWTGQRRPMSEAGQDAAASHGASPTGDTVRRGDLWNQQDGQQNVHQNGQQAGQPYGQPYGQDHGPRSSPGVAPAAGDQGGYGHPGGYGTPPPAGYGQGEPVGYGQPGYGSTPPVPQGQPYGQGDWNAPPPAGRPGRRKGPLIAAGLGVVVLVAGAVTWFVLGSGGDDDDAPSLTYNGKQINDPSGVLTKAEDALKSTVKERNGASNDQTRCYFAKPKTPPSGGKSTDVENELRCGPVLFLEGDESEAYLRVPLTDSPNGSSVDLTPPDTLTGIQPSSIGSVTLERPDGEKPPSGSGGLKVPTPPKAEKDLLTTGTLPSGVTAKSLDNATMAGYDLRATITKVAELDTYGTGDDARSAPDGQKLIAFQVEYSEGDTDDDGAKPKLVVDGSSPRELPEASGSTYIIAAIPQSGSAQLLMDDGRYKQTLSLPAGTPGANNIQVLQRQGRVDNTEKKATVPIALRQGSRTGSAAWAVTLRSASLDFWALNNESVHPSSTKNAMLSVTVVRRYTDETRNFAFNVSLMKLRAGGKTYACRDVAPGPTKVRGVFEVPASFKSGTLVIGGSTVVQGITVRITKGATLPINLQN